MAVLCVCVCVCYYWFSFFNVYNKHTNIYLPFVEFSQFVHYTFIIHYTLYSYNCVVFRLLKI